ncbi:Metalloendoproteinase 1 [Morella rubra]|uniref:Metalloendoproteinase 1 n=1 Tax=Morella rubra TaxID=262757 RepID=A0A6A1V9G6_9ROSI|nr:Metalloendoproteinase 1 [Morella rubra]
MRFVYWFAIAVSVLFSSTTVSAHFFPNVTSIPPWLNATHGAWDSFRNLSGCHHGESVDGLSKLKNYLRYFGYINSTSNFTDDFDEALKYALKTYQKNFNLNATGELDSQTVQQIVRPRCGVPDIVNGSTSMNSGKTTPSSNSTQFHTVSHYTFFDGKPRWPENKRDLTYAFQPENQLSDDVKSVFTRAFARWSTVTELTFTMTDSYTDADLRIGFFVGDHGDGEPFDGVLGTLAHAFSPTSGRLHLWTRLRISNSSTPSHPDPEVDRSDDIRMGAVRCHPVWLLTNTMQQNLRTPYKSIHLTETSREAPSQPPSPLITRGMMISRRMT